MVTRRDFTAEACEACRQVLLELTHLMGQFRDHMVIVGGWVPTLLFQQAPEIHAGTLDIDLALDFGKITAGSYHTILEILRGAGYRQDSQQPYRFFRHVAIAGGEPIAVEVDLLAGEYGGTGRGHRTQKVQDVHARKARGCDLAFSTSVHVTLEGTLPGGARDQATLKVAGMVPFLVMKGMALHDRLKQKDAYDIVYCVEQYPGGASALASAFEPHLDNPLVREGLQKIRKHFSTVDHVGPTAVADFLDATDPEEQAAIRRRAYEAVTAWLDALWIEPYQDG